MKIRAGKKRAINKLIRIVADDELTTKQIYDNRKSAKQSLHLLFISNKFLLKKPIINV